MSYVSYGTRYVKPGPVSSYDPTTCCHERLPDVAYTAHFTENELMNLQYQRSGVESRLQPQVMNYIAPNVADTQSLYVPKYMPASVFPPMPKNTLYFN